MARQRSILFRGLNAEQKEAHESILEAVNDESGGLFFVFGHGGRTAHSRFGVLITLKASSTCNVDQGSLLALLMQRASLIIWDEALMHHYHGFEVVNRTLQDILGFRNIARANKPFGGIPVIL